MLPHVSGDELWLIMELLSEGTLHSRLQDSPPISVRERLLLASDVARAIEYLHKQRTQVEYRALYVLSHDLISSFCFFFVNAAPRPQESEHSPVQKTRPAPR